MASLISAASSVGLLPATFRAWRRPPAEMGLGRRGGGCPTTVECSSRPQKKGTAHQMKTRPKKTQPWDVKRKGPTIYPSLPPLPPDWTLAAGELTTANVAGEVTTANVAGEVTTATVADAVSI